MLSFRLSVRSLRSRILGALVSLVAVAVVVVVVVQDTRQKQMLLELEEDRGTAIARSLAAATSTPLLTYNYVGLQQLSEKAVKEEGVEYVVILDKEGVVAGYSNRPHWQGKRLNDAVSQRASLSKGVLIQKASSLTGAPQLDIAVPVYVEGSPVKWGTIRVGLSLESVYAEVYRTRAWVLGFGFAVLAFASLVARWLSRRITDPLERLVEATGELARGNFDYRVGIKTGDEIGNLSRKFDDMSAIIRENQLEVERTNAELASLNASLEEKVEERTQALQQAEEKYRLLVEESPNAICVIQDGKLKFFNHAFCATFGYSHEELTAEERDFADFIDASHRGRVTSVLASPLNGVESSGFIREIEARRKDGSSVLLDMRSIWVFYEGEPALEAILVDVTGQREMQERIVSNERLRALGEMASGVAHDFNNILGVILARAQLLQRREIDDEVARGLRIIEKAARDGGASVRRIQEFSRVRTDQEFLPVHINTVLEDAIEMTRSQWEDEAHRTKNEIQVVFDLQEVPRILGDVSELRELFINLILNAVDAITGKGTITLSTSLKSNDVLVTIADTGHGMPEEVQRKLFDPFFSTKGPQGTGLGMSIAYGAIRRHGGDIAVSTAEGSGTTFRITFPVPAGEEARPAEPSVTMDTPLLKTSGGRVLVVDDEKDIRELVADVLKEGGYEVETASGGEEALSLARDNDFDLVATDLGMPGLSGWEVARGCREISPGIAVILLTGWGAVLDPREAEEAGVNRILKKPFDMGDLLQAVEELLQTPRPNRAA